MLSAVPGTKKEVVRPGDGAWASRSPCHSVAKYPGECTPRIEMVSKSEPGFGYSLDRHAFTLDRAEPPDSTTMGAHLSKFDSNVSDETESEGKGSRGKTALSPKHHLL